MCATPMHDYFVLRGRLVLEDTVVEDGIIEFDGATITRVRPVSEYEGEVPEP